MCVFNLVVDEASSLFEILKPHTPLHYETLCAEYEFTRIAISIRTALPFTMSY